MTDREQLTAEQFGFRTVPYMGVIFVVAEAVKLGFENGHPDWSNLGQGQPEVGPMQGAPPRISNVQIDPADHAYGPLEGTPEIRAAVAAYYNRVYRRGKKSQYTAENVSIAQGGRLALTRAMAALGSEIVGYQLPDYTAYEDMFNLHLGRLTPALLRTREEEGFQLTPDLFRRGAEESGFRVFVVSNPCNATGNVLQGESLLALVAEARTREITLLMDEFYSHFIYQSAPDGVTEPAPDPVSSAEFVEDVNRDPVVIFDGLTKSHRYPGWRLGWALGPPRVVEAIARTASALDGGPSRIVQRAALDALSHQRVKQETNALRENFCRKRNLMVRELEAMGIRFAQAPAGTFYCWTSLADLPDPLNNATTFFREALRRKVLTVPGEFFDVNPGKRRRGTSPYRQWMRFSFGPDMENMKMGMARLKEMVESYR